MSYPASQSGNQDTDPMKDKDDVQDNPDPKIDQDFPGFPNNPATREKVTPGTPAEKKSADTDEERDGEKKLGADQSKAGSDASGSDEAGSDGSANAFDRTELHPPAEPKAPETPVKKRRSDGSANAFERTEGSPLNEEEEDGPDSYY